MQKNKCPGCGSNQLLELGFFPLGSVRWGLMEWVSQSFFGMPLNPAKRFKPGSVKLISVKSLGCAGCGLISQWIPDFELHKQSLSEACSNQQALALDSKGNRLISG